jgi:hypothetical protein
MTSKIILKKSSVANRVPVTDVQDSVNGLTYGELALNYADGILYYKTSSNTIAEISGGAVDSVAGKTGAVTLTSTDVGLGNVENKSSITIRGEITSGNITTALGFTPYNVTNPSGYTNNTGTVTGVSGTAPIVSSGGTTPAISMAAASSGVNGYMTGAYATKLDGIATGATNVTNNNQLTNGAGYITGYNESDTLATVTGRGASTTIASTFSGGLTVGGFLKVSSGGYGNQFIITPGTTSNDGVTLESRWEDENTFNGWGPIIFKNGSGELVKMDINSGLEVYAGGSFTGNLTVAGNQVLDAGNYNSYALPLSGGTVSSTRINPRVSSQLTAPSISPTIELFDQYNQTDQSEALTINQPAYNPVDGNKLLFRIFTTATASAITWDATYTAIGVTLPTTTVTNKTIYVGCIYNEAATRWDVVAVTTQA